VFEIHVYIIGMNYTFLTSIFVPRSTPAALIHTKTGRGSSRKCCI